MIVMTTNSVLTPITLEELLPGRNFTAPGSPCIYIRQSNNGNMPKQTKKLITVRGFSLSFL